MPHGEDQVVTVPTGLSLDERIDRGHYGWRHGGVTEERFPIEQDQCGEKTQRLFHFARSLSSEDAARLIRESGFEPARIGDILAFGEKFPETQRHHPVIALGSVADVDQKLSVPALWFDGERRTLDAIWYDGDWHRNYRFLGVRRHGAPAKILERAASPSNKTVDGLLALVGEPVRVPATGRFVAREKFGIGR